MREIRGGVFQGRFYNLLISKNNTFWAPQISQITFQVVFFNLTDPAAPTLISVVRLTHPVTSVVLDAQNNLAYVGCGVQGVAMVDLAGPASVQPLDQDRNGIDDRVLGQVDTVGTAGRLALNLARGVGYVADGPGGLAVVQLMPPRTSIEDVRRDPVAAAQGDEQSILETRQAFVTDDALQVTVNAVVPPQTEVFLSIEETPEAGGPRLLTFPDGTTSTPLVSGINSLTIQVRKDHPAQGSQVSLKIMQSGGSVLTRFDLRYTPADPGTTALTSLFLVPQTAVLPVSAQTVQLSVGGIFADGRIFNLTDATTGTTYVSGNAIVATVDSRGLVTAVAGGSATISATNRNKTAASQVKVERPLVLTAISVNSPYVTLTSAGAQQALRVTGRFSDGTAQDVTQGFGTLYSSSNPGVVTVDADGVLTAVGEGTATVTITNGALQAQTSVAAEFRIPPDVTGISLAPFTQMVTTDQGQVLARATISGTGSLEGLTVTFALSGVTTAQLTGITDYSGIALVKITGLANAGTGTVMASIVNPATSATLSDSQSLVVEPGSGDNEPNNDMASAARLGIGKTITGTLGVTTDPRDTYRVETTTSGTLSISLTLPEGTTPGDTTVIVLSENGTELGRFTPTELTNTFTLKIATNQGFIVVETGNAPISYTLATAFEQTPVVITTIIPTSGGPGTLVTITGSGFSSAPTENIVLFTGIAGKVVSATSTELQVIVPANAINGVVEVIVGSKQTTGLQFITGSVDPLPLINPIPPDPFMVRFNPIIGTRIVVNRLLVNFASTVTHSEAQTIAISLGSRVVGYLPTFNTYILEFPNVTTIAGLESLRGQIKMNPLVLSTLRSTLGELANKGRIGLRDGGVSRGIEPYQRINIVDALNKIRSDNRFNKSDKFSEATVAIVDSGFDPESLEKFKDTHGNVVVRYFDLFNPASLDPLTSLYKEQGQLSDDIGHGTKVTSVIATVNGKDSRFSGILSSLFQADEKPFRVLVYRVVDKEHLNSGSNDTLLENTLGCLKMPCRGHL